MKVVHLTEKGKKAVIYFLVKHLKFEYVLIERWFAEIEDSFSESANKGESFGFEVSQFSTKSNRPEIFYPDHDHYEIIEAGND